MKTLLFIIKENVINYGIMLLNYRKAYDQRVQLRANYARTGKYDFLWSMLHDNLETGLPQDYGDADFYTKNFVNDSPEEMYKLSFKWAKFNPNHNRYYWLKKSGKEQNMTGWASSKNDASIGTWRTFITTNLNGNPAWKHGELIDFDNSTFGVQRVKFEILRENGEAEKAFRNSTCLPFKKFGCIWIRGKRLGYENNLPQIQNYIKRFKGKKNIEAYKRWKKLKYKKIKK